MTFVYAVLVGCATVPTSEPMTSYQRIVDAQKTRVKALLDTVVDDLASDITKTGATDKNW